MRRLARRLFTLCSAVSLLACVAVCVLWVRSPGASDALSRRTPRTIYTLKTIPHGVEFQSIGRGHRREPGWAVYSERREGRGFRTTWLPPAWHRFGFGWESELLSAEVRHRRLVVPFWFLSIDLLLMPGVGVLRLARSRRRSTRGRCPACGYDLRATPGRCPECGTAAAAAEPEGAPS